MMYFKEFFSLPAFHVAVFSLCILAALGVAIYLPADQLVLLEAARQWLEGGTLYIDFIETNPPLFIWIWTPAVWASTWMPFSAQVLHDLDTLGLILLSLWLCARLLHHTALSSTVRGYLWWALAALMIVLPEPTITFGERPHWEMICVVPYLLLRTPGFIAIPLSRSMRTGIALLAGIGFCIKPHYAVLWASAQAYALLHGRGLWKEIFLYENRIIFAVAACYLLLIGLITPEFYTSQLPMNLAHYWYYKALGYYSETSLFKVLLAFTIPILFLRNQPSSPRRPWLKYLLFLYVGVVIQALLNQGWIYTWYPVWVILCLWLGVLVYEYTWQLSRAEIDDKKRERAHLGRLACWLILFAIATTTVSHTSRLLTYNVGATLVAHHTWGRTMLSDLQSVIGSPERGQPSLPVLFIQTPSWPSQISITDPSLTFASRFTNLWMLGSYFNEGAPPEHASHYARIRRWMVEDIQRFQPRVILVDRSPRMRTIAHENPDILSFFLKDPAFRQEWKAYRLHEVVDRCDKDEGIAYACRYEVYRPGKSRTNSG